MLKNIINEFVKSLRKKSTIVYILCAFGLVLLANIAVISFRIIYGENEGTFAYNLFAYATWCFIIPYYSCVFIADIVFGKETPNPYIKDRNTKSLKRWEIYVSKLFASILLATVFLIATAVIFMGVTTLFQLKDGLASWYEITDFLGKMVIAIPIWIAGLSFGMMFLFGMNKKKHAYIAYFILTLIIPRFIMFFAAEPYRIAFFRFLRTYTLTQNMTLIPYPADPARSVPLTIGLGIIYSIIATAVGIFCYNRKKFD